MEYHELFGLTAVVASAAMRRVLEYVRRVAPTDAVVLVQGESGVGKELIARAVHKWSRRAAGPWVDVNCAALPDQLIESELFGYEKGAFSGADSQKQGLFELAHEGTLFLDEIAELNPRLQVKLLRVLDGMPYFRLGGSKKVQVDVRVVAATNQDLETAVESGQFRLDLYHRLNELLIEAPPLRERPEDILAIAEWLLRRTKPGMVLSPAAADALTEYSWPGNIRELRNALTKAGLNAPGQVIELNHLPAALRKPFLVDSPAIPDLLRLAARTSSDAGPSPTLDDLEKQTILRVLHQTGGHQQRAADVLGISRRTLSRKLREYRQHAPLETGIEDGLR